MRRTLRAVNPRKAAGPDGVCGRVLKELVGVFTKIFDQSLSQSTVPSCLKSSTNVPLLKKNYLLPQRLPASSTHPCGDEVL